MSDVKRRIGLTMRIQQADGYHEPRDALAQCWADFLAVALPAAKWMYLPSLGAEAIADYCDAWGLNGLILTGGEDVGSSPLRDATERTLLDWAERDAKPVLGICRGLQLMTSLSGGHLQHVEGHVASRHPLSGRYTHEVNSYHGLGIKDCPRGYEILARAPDDTIEAIGHLELPWQGWMWHPERERISNAHDIEAIRRVFA